jgi:hypothetical protein
MTYQVRSPERHYIGGRTHANSGGDQGVIRYTNFNVDRAFEPEPIKLGFRFRRSVNEPALALQTPLSPNIHTSRGAGQQPK